MSFKENINRICKQKGITLTNLVTQVKGSSAFTSAINTKGSLPKENEMVEMARILNCSVIDFFSDEEDVTEESTISSHDEDEEDIIRVYRTLSRRNRHEFMTMVYEFENRKELEGDTDLSAIG